MLQPANMFVAIADHGVSCNQRPAKRRGVPESVMPCHVHMACNVPERWLRTLVMHFAHRTCGQKGVSDGS